MQNTFSAYTESKCGNMSDMCRYGCAFLQQEVLLIKRDFHFGVFLPKSLTTIVMVDTVLILFHFSSVIENSVRCAVRNLEVKFSWRICFKLLCVSHFSVLS